MYPVPFSISSLGHNDSHVETINYRCILITHFTVKKNLHVGEKIELHAPLIKDTLRNGQ